MRMAMARGWCCTGMQNVERTLVLYRNAAVDSARRLGYLYIWEQSAPCCDLPTEVLNTTGAMPQAAMSQPCAPLLAMSWTYHKRSVLQCAHHLTGLSARAAWFCLEWLSGRAHSAGVCARACGWSSPRLPCK